MGPSDVVIQQQSLHLSLQRQSCTRSAPKAAPEIIGGIQRQVATILGKAKAARQLRTLSKNLPCVRAHRAWSIVSPSAGSAAFHSNNVVLFRRSARRSGVAHVHYDGFS